MSSLLFRRTIVLGWHCFLGIGASSVSGCTRESVPQEAVTTRDSLGVAIVESARPVWVFDSGWVVDRPPLVELPTELPVMSGIEMVTRLSDGRLALLSSTANQVAIFDTTGRLVRTFGRRGEGPGEFRTAERMQRLPGDTLVIWDTSFGPRTWFDTLGRVVKIAHIDLSRFGEAMGREHWSEVFTPLANGAFVAHINRRIEEPPVAGKLRRVPRGYLIIDTNYSSHSLGWYGGYAHVYFRRNGRMISTMTPYPLQSSVAAGGNPERIAVTDGDPSEVAIFDPAGRLLRIMRRTDRGQPYPKEAQAVAANAFLVAAATPDERREREAFLEALPDQIGTIVDLRVDSEGCVWARGSTEGWYVFSSEGRWLGLVRMPVSEIYEIGRDYLIGSKRDSLGVIHVAEYALRRTTLSARGGPTPP